MERYKSILVGVDLSKGDRFVSDELELTEANLEAIRSALWLAKKNSARLCFFSALDIGTRTQTLIEEDTGSEPCVVDLAQQQLKELVGQATSEGVAAESCVKIGKSWLEIIRQVLRGHHDLVIVGTRHLSGVQSFLMGSTGIKLLRKCPCPVWVTQPKSSRQLTSILVAHDLRPVGDLAMELGCWMAKLHDAQLHVLHAAEYPELETMLPARVSAENAAKYREQAREHIAGQLRDFHLTKPAEVHLVSETADSAILEHIEQHSVELLVMGTTARTGIPGLLTGNTAERLLPLIPCSVLAVKPDGFETPVTLEEETS